MVQKRRGRISHWQIERRAEIRVAKRMSVNTDLSLILCMEYLYTFLSFKGHMVVYGCVCRECFCLLPFFVGRPSQAGAAAAPMDVSRLDFRIGLVVSAKKHPDADSLYVEEGECNTWTQSS